MPEIAIKHRAATSTILAIVTVAPIDRRIAADPRAGTDAQLTTLLHG